MGTAGEWHRNVHPTRTLYSLEFWIRLILTKYHIILCVKMIISSLYCTLAKKYIYKKKTSEGLSSHLEFLSRGSLRESDPDLCRCS